MVIAHEEIKCDESDLEEVICIPAYENTEEDLRIRKEFNQKQKNKKLNNPSRAMIKRETQKLFDDEWER